MLARSLHHRAIAMQFIDDLVLEHALIDKTLGALQVFVAHRIRGDAGPRDGEAFARYFRVFVGGGHHDREERVLFPALQHEVGVPSDRGPIAALLAQHHALSSMLQDLTPLLTAPLDEPHARHDLVDLTRRYTHGLWKHIDAENSVLFPECEARLPRVGIYALEVVSPDALETDARVTGERLVATYAPVTDTTILRGDGCVMCPAFGESCGGVEREWWNEWEWEEFADHVG